MTKSPLAIHGGVYISPCFKLLFSFFSLRLRDLRGLFQPLGFHHPPMAPFAPSSLWSCTDTRRQSEDGSVLRGGRRCIQNSRNENADNNVLFVMWKCSFSFLLTKKKKKKERFLRVTVPGVVLQLIQLRWVSELLEPRRGFCHPVLC